MWDGERWSEQSRPAAASTPTPISLPRRPTTDPSSAELKRERSNSGWSVGSLVGLGVGLLALLTVGGCVVLVGVVPLIAVRSQGTLVTEEVEVAVAIPETTVFEVPATNALEPGFGSTTAGPDGPTSDAVGPLATYGSAAEVVGILDRGAIAVFEITVEEPVDVTESVLAADAVGADDGEVLVGIPAAIILRESPTDQLPAVGVFDWTIVGGATATTSRPAVPGTEAIGCDVIDADLTVVDEWSLGVERRGLVCITVPFADFDHPETRVVLTAGDGAPVTWIR